MSLISGNINIIGALFSSVRETEPQKPARPLLPPLATCHYRSNPIKFSPSGAATVNKTRVMYSYGTATLS